MERQHSLAAAESLVLQNNRSHFEMSVYMSSKISMTRPIILKSSGKFCIGSGQDMDFLTRGKSPPTRYFAQNKQNFVLHFK